MQPLPSMGSRPDPICSYLLKSSQCDYLTGLVALVLKGYYLGHRGQEDLGI